MNSFLKWKLEVLGKLLILGTDNVQTPISEHIFAPNRACCLYLVDNLALKLIYTLRYIRPTFCFVWIAWITSLQFIFWKNSIWCLSAQSSSNILSKSERQIHIRIPGIGLELACKWGQCGEVFSNANFIHFFLMIFPRMSLHCKLVPVQYREYDINLFLVIFFRMSLHCKLRPFLFFFRLLS